MNLFQDSLGVIIVHWRNIERTKNVLDQILSWKEINFHVHLIQNETSEDLFQDLTHPRLSKTCSKENLGFSGGNNLGLKASIRGGHKYSFLLNPDAFIKETELLKLLLAAEEQKFMFALSPVILEKSNGKVNSYLGGKNIAKYSNTRISQDEILAEIGKEDLIEVFYNIGAAMLIKNEVLDDIGFLDTDYFFSGEIADICQRARIKNYKCLTLLNAEAYHSIDEQKLRSTLYKYYSLRNRFLFIKKHEQFKVNKPKWRKELVKNFVFACLTFNFSDIRTLVLCSWDIILGNYGNKNYKFSKNISTD